MKRQRITDTARMDWLASTKAEIEYVTGKVGPGWIRHEGWRVATRTGPFGNGDTLRVAIDAAMSATKPKGVTE